MKRACQIAVLCALLCALSGCKSWHKVVEVPVYIHDTAYTVKELHDSTYIDSWHTVYQKGDTIFVTNEVTKTKIVTKTDTAYKYVEKPVVVSKMETVEVEKPLRWWQKSFMWVGVASLLVALLCVLAKVWQLFGKR